MLHPAFKVEKETPFKKIATFWKVYLWLLLIFVFLMGSGIFMMVSVAKADDIACQYRADWALMFQLMLMNGIWGLLLIAQLIPMTVRQNEYWSLGSFIAIFISSVNFVPSLPLLILMQMSCKSITSTSAFVVYWIWQVIGLVIFVAAVILLPKAYQKNVEYVIDDIYPSRMPSLLVNKAFPKIYAEMAKGSLSDTSIVEYVKNFRATSHQYNLLYFDQFCYWVISKNYLTHYHGNDGNEGSDQICPYCWEKFKIGETILAKPECGRFSHQDCFRQHFSLQNQCKTCGTPFLMTLVSQLERKIEDTSKDHGEEPLLT